MIKKIYEITCNYVLSNAALREMVDSEPSEESEVSIC